ncbi:MAG: hypothetical protein ACQEP5_02955 [Actinomycetota bacterium]
MKKERKGILYSNIGPLLFKFFYPAITGMLISALYNFVGTLFVRKTVQIMMLAIGFMTGVGCIHYFQGSGQKQVGYHG